MHGFEVVTLRTLEVIAGLLLGGWFFGRTNRQGRRRARAARYHPVRVRRATRARCFNEAQTKLMYRRQHGRCTMCGEPLRGRRIERDHIIPYVEGGPTKVSNGQLLHKYPCHLTKTRNDYVKYGWKGPMPGSNRRSAA